MHPLKLVGTPIPASDREKLGVATAPYQNLLVTIVYRPVPKSEDESRYMHIELTPNRTWDLTYTYWSYTKKGPAERVVMIKYDGFAGCGWSAHSQFPGGQRILLDLSSWHVGGLFGNMDASLLIAVVGIQERDRDVYLGPSGKEEVFESLHEYNPFEDENKIDKLGPTKVIDLPAAGFLQVVCNDRGPVSIRDVLIGRSTELGAEFAFIKEPKLELLALVPIFLCVVNGEADNNGQAGDPDGAAGNADSDPVGDDATGQDTKPPMWYEIPD